MYKFQGYSFEAFDLICSSQQLIVAGDAAVFCDKNEGKLDILLRNYVRTSDGRILTLILQIIVFVGASCSCLQNLPEERTGPT